MRTQDQQRFLKRLLKRIEIWLDDLFLLMFTSRRTEPTNTNTNSTPDRNPTLVGQPIRRRTFLKRTTGAALAFGLLSASSYAAVTNVPLAGHSQCVTLTWNGTGENTYVQFGVPYYLKANTPCVVCRAQSNYPAGVTQCPDTH